MSLSDRLRPDVECAPWVIEEIKKLEALFRPGLRVYKGDHVVQIATGEQLFTEPYTGADDIPRACAAALDRATGHD